MKRLFLSLMMATAVLSGTFAQSEEKKTTFGVKAEMNSNFYLVGDSEIITATGNGFGANAGLFLKTNIIDNLAIQVELLCQYRNADFTILGQEYTLINWGIEVPAYIMGQFAMGSGRFFFGAGPYGIAGISAGMNDVDMYAEGNGLFTLSRWNLGVGMIVGIELGCGLQFNVNYKYGMFNSNLSNSGNLVENTAAIGLGYRF
jgi:hypothetical protein